MSFKGLTLAVFAVCALMCAPGRAEPRHAVVRTFMVGVEELDYYPVYAVQKGEYVGAAREILDAFAQAKGYVFTYRPLPIKRLYAELLAGGIDFKFPDNPSWASDVKQGQPLAYSQPVIGYIDGVLVRPEDVGRGSGSVRLLGTVSGFTPFAWLDLIRQGKVQVKENPRMDLLLKQVAMERLDGAYASVAVANYQLDATLGTPDALAFDSSLPHSRDYYRLSTLKQAKVVAEFDAWMAANAGLVKAIKERTGAEKGIQ
jgi:hypothetical protein